MLVSGSSVSASICTVADVNCDTGEHIMLIHMLKTALWQNGSDNRI